MAELLVILVLVLLNGVLSGAEMAVVTAKKAKLEQLAEAGRRGARAALLLRENPERFLASVQVGITLLGAVAGAFGGSAFTGRILPLFQWLGCGAASAELAFATVVLVVTYLSVVLGELIPKSLALRVPEAFASRIARPLLLLAWLARPVIWTLTASSNLVLRLFGDRTNFVEAKLTREDLQHLLDDASTGGALDVHTGRLMTRALEFARLRVREVMVNCRDVVALPVNADAAAIRAALLDRGHRRVPIYDGAIDNIIGYVLREDVLAVVWDGKTPSLAALRREPFFVPEVLPAERALRDLQRRSLHLAIVVNEHGGVAGIITLEDLLEELVGEIFHERDAAAPARIQEEAAGTWLVHGTVTLRELERQVGIHLPELGGERTVGGLVVSLAGNRIPTTGETVRTDGVTLVVVEASPRRVRQARLRLEGPATNA